jgi:hypothetical protein
MKARVLYLLRRYPQLSETYIETEIRAVARRHPIAIVALCRAEQTSAENHPFTRLEVGDDQGLRDIARKFQPTVLHGHYAHHTPALSRAPALLGIPFSVRAHSYDVLDRPANLPAAVSAVNDDRCLGLLTFPFTMDGLVDAGMKPEKLVASHPVVDIDRFSDTGPMVTRS